MEMDDIANCSFPPYDSKSVMSVPQHLDQVQNWIVLGYNAANFSEHLNMFCTNHHNAI